MLFQASILQKKHDVSLKLCEMPSEGFLGHDKPGNLFDHVEEPVDATEDTISVRDLYSLEFELP